MEEKDKPATKGDLTDMQQTIAKMIMEQKKDMQEENRQYTNRIIAEMRREHQEYTNKMVGQLHEDTAILFKNVFDKLDKN